mmetsp:Transcript_33505/g.70445  ORF Transcript_33505/g.70445 Transcript_33505/m.70445 type:complete len:93 (+) Transcript_33505:1672-1950(+)
MESHLGMGGKNVVYELSMEGPYWLHSRKQRMDKVSNNEKELKLDGYVSGTTLGKSGTDDLPQLSSSILTKTHCGSRCVFCAPNKYLESPASF